MSEKGRPPLGRFVVEFLLITVGVFVALLVDSFHESRVEKRLSEDYRARVQSEVNEIEESMAYIKAHSEAIQIETAALVPFFEDAAEPTDSLRTLIQLYNSSRRSTIQSPHAAYEDLVATGSLRSFGDPDLRSFLKRSYNLFYQIEERAMFAASYRELVRQLIPLRLQWAVREQCPGPAEGGLAECEIELEGLRLAPVFQAIEDRGELKGFFRVHYHDLGIFLGRVTTAHEAAVQLRDRLAGN